jgi:hypothetical protein
MGALAERGIWGCQASGMDISAPGASSCGYTSVILASPAAGATLYAMSKAERASIEVSLRALMALIDGLWREHPILETEMLTDEQETALHQLDLALRNALSAFDPTKR